MARLKGCAHDLNITCAIESIVTASVGHLDQLLLNTLIAEFAWVDEVSGTKLVAPFLLLIVHVHDDDFARAILHGPLDDRKTDAAGTEYGHVGALLDLGCDDSSAVARGDPTTKEARSVHGSLVCDGDDRNIRDDGVLRECGRAHEVQKILAFALESASAIWHDSLALGRSDLAAQVRLA